MWKKIISVTILTTHICLSFVFANDGIPLITNSSDLDNYVGKIITIRGYVTNTKIPTILGVDVKSDKPDLRGELAQATGVLYKWTVTKDELEQSIKEKGMFANRGPGTFYCLKEPGLNVLAQVVSWN